MKEDFIIFFLSHSLPTSLLPSSLPPHFLYLFLPYCFLSLCLQYEFYSPADHLTSMDQSSSTPPQSALPPSTPAEPETPRPIWLNNPTFIELQNNTPPSGLPSPLASEAVESSVVGTESHTQSQPPSEPPNPAEDFEDASSVHEAPFEYSLTLTMDRSLSDSKPVAQEDFQEYVLRLDANEQKKFNKQFQVSARPHTQHRQTDTHTYSYIHTHI